jgi:hypothetical protein
LTTATIAKVLLHACPRCHGDLFLDNEDKEYGCLQCGRVYRLAYLEARGTIDQLLAAAMTPATPVPRPVPASITEWNDDAV